MNISGTWDRMASCGRLFTGLSTWRHIYKPISNRLQDSILPHL